MPTAKSLRISVRLLILAAALFFVIGGPLPIWMERLVPALSPLTVFAESIAQRTWYAGLFWSIPPLAVLLLAVLKGRLFCQWLCPLGTLYSLPQKVSLKKRILPIRLNALIFWIIISASLLGLPALLWLDPLSTFRRAGAWTEAAAWIPGLLIPIFLLLSFFQPQVWCTHLCPLGYGFDLANFKTGKAVFRRDRRQFITGLGLGAGAAVILPRINKSAPTPSVLPPGATEHFAETCTRCYACVDACPVEIIKVKKGGPLSELAMPELVFNEYGCEESCNRCSQLCPTGAIRTLSPDEKWRRQVGVARVEKEKCLAWADNEYCMVCDEYCPYNAIETVWEGGIACPVVDPALCRGCGACEGACPAYRAGKAIFVHALNPQQKIKG
ncbi:MAG: 4Fe-4S binding protein [Kiritimatiellales bacterium]|nr:4Fe-4S binding protein [Kiritimatiellota bacterium]MBL7011941.1 4Fe-4S binding protein [Kiritimatiellales bacterium]